MDEFRQRSSELVSAADIRLSEDRDDGKLVCEFADTIAAETKKCLRAHRLRFIDSTLKYSWVC